MEGIEIIADGAAVGGRRCGMEESNGEGEPKERRRSSENNDMNGFGNRANTSDLGRHPRAVVRAKRIVRQASISLPRRGRAPPPSSKLASTEQVTIRYVMFD
ncbi:hypothetical protein J6590_036000 [Homalodisca vitripennis]|nr:hypothetical protein J6590_036000 [Homalodisca vitripennis]